MGEKFRNHSSRLRDSIQNINKKVWGRVFIFILVAIVATGFFAYYINQYLVGSRASTITLSNASVSLSSEEVAPGESFTLTYTFPAPEGKNISQITLPINIIGGNGATVTNSLTYGSSGSNVGGNSIQPYFSEELYENIEDDPAIGGKKAILSLSAGSKTIDELRNIIIVSVNFTASTGSGNVDISLDTSEAEIVGRSGDPSSPDVYSVGSLTQTVTIGDTVEPIPTIAEPISCELTTDPNSPIDTPQANYYRVCPINDGIPDYDDCFSFTGREYYDQTLVLGSRGQWNTVIFVDQEISSYDGHNFDSQNFGSLGPRAIVQSIYEESAQTSFYRYVPLLEDTMNVFKPEIAVFPPLEGDGEWIEEPLDITFGEIEGFGQATITNRSNADGPPETYVQTIIGEGGEVGYRRFCDPTVDSYLGRETCRLNDNNRDLDGFVTFNFSDFDETTDPGEDRYSGYNAFTTSRGEDTERYYETYVSWDGRTVWNRNCPVQTGSGNINFSGCTSWSESTVASLYESLANEPDVLPNDAVLDIGTFTYSDEDGNEFLMESLIATNPGFVGTCTADYTRCEGGQCLCLPDRYNCDNDWTNGCESGDKCGNGSVCREDEDCESGICDEATGRCVSSRSTPVPPDSGGYCRVDSDCGANSSCNGGSCTCDSGYYNCDGDPTNGCESRDNTCGNGRGGFCSEDNVEDACQENSVCRDGSCACADGYNNCDGDNSNGCETFGPCANRPPGGGGTGNTTLNIRLKFNGIGINVPPVQDTLRVKVTIFNEDLLPAPIEREATFTIYGQDQSGIRLFEGTVAADIPEGDGYAIFIKGEKHIQKRVCDASPTESDAGRYRCIDGDISLVNGTNDFDFTNIYQLAGDLSINGQQNGFVDSADIQFVRGNLTRTDANILDVADLNLDGIVDTQDYSLAIFTLSFKYDDIVTD